MSERSDQPVLVHVGYHKTGTSWLQGTYFRAHPQFALLNNSVAPQLDPFVRYVVSTSDRVFDAGIAQELLLKAMPPDSMVPVISAERLSGHAFSGGFDQVRIADRLKAAVPGARLLVVIRDQVALLESVYRQLVEAGYPGTFKSLVEGEGWTAPWFCLDFYDFDLVYRMYVQRFGAERVLLMSYEQFAADPNEFVRQVCEFMSVPFMTPDASRDVNRSVPASIMKMMRPLNRFRRTERNRWPILPFPESVMGRVVASLGRQIPARGGRMLSAAERDFIRSRFADSNARLRAAIGGDRGDWKKPPQS